MTPLYYAICIMTTLYKYDIIIKTWFKMSVTSAQIKATTKYNDKAYDRLAIRVKKGEAETIKAHAESKGLSLNAYINELIKRDMQGN